jgi:LuxR family maltose regulon positive regulatory protein
MGRLRITNHTSAVIRGDRLVYQENGSPIQIVVGTPDWYRWLATASTFAFSSEGENFTAYQEQADNKREGRYWKAYRKQGSKLASVYLGKSERLTLDRLKAAAAVLAHEEDGTPSGSRTKASSEHEVPSRTLQLPGSHLPREDDSRGELLLVRDQLLTIKFSIPVTSHLVIPRPRLVSLLNGIIQRESTKLVLVSAPAGFGKTTLLATWLKSLPENRPPIAWVSLDEEDNDPIRFWKYVFTALDLCQPGLCTSLLTFLHSQQAPRLPYVLTAFINTLTAHTESLLLVLDDYHVITEQATHASFTYLLEHLPPQLSLILSTRSDPPLPLARLHGRGQAVEIRTEQLRCTEEEADAFLTQTMGLSLSASEVRAIEARTEGWIAGMQIAALSMQGRIDPTRILHELSGSQRCILDYLIDEVLQQQSEAIQVFLLHTSILERLCASLCDQVMGESGSQQVLEHLERANLFVVPLDTQRQWYRYHHLFAEALHYHLEQTWAEEIHTLHLRASQWYARQGHLDEAVQHAIHARAWAWAADLIEQAPAPPIWGFNVLEKQRHWLEKLPLEVVQARPRLCLTYAKTLHMIASPTQTETWLQAAEAALASPTAGLPVPAVSTTAEQKARQHWLGELAALHAVHISVYIGDGQAALACCQQALTLLSEQHLAARADVALAQALALYALGDMRAATAYGLQASALAQAAGNLFSAITMLSVAAHCSFIWGRLHEIQRIAERAAQLVQGPKGLPFPLKSWPLLGRADILVEWNRLDEALDIALQAIQFGEQTGTTVFSNLGYMALMRVHLARGELDVAHSVLQRAEHALLNVPYPFLHSIFVAVDRVRLWLACGELERAGRWAQELLQQGREPSLMAGEKENIALVRILLAQKRPEEALSLLDSLLVSAQTGQRWGHAIEMLILQALAYQMCHSREEALATLSRAVSLAEPEGYIRRFVDEGAPMEALLSRLRKRERRRRPTPYLDALLAAFAASRDDRAGTCHASGSGQHTEHKLISPLLEPLSKRELEVLCLLEQGASNQEIAEDLVLTLSTVKSHVRNILLKLGVGNRTQAVKQAHILGLLSEES